MMLAYKRNYYALLAAILGNMSAQKAMTELDIHFEEKENGYKTIKSKYNISIEEIETAKKLKEEGWTWVEIGKELGCPKNTIYRRVKRYMGDSWSEREW